MKRREDSGNATVRHANRYDGLTWCDARTDWDEDDLAVVGDQAPLEDLAEVTCVECLSEIALYGQAAVLRLRDLSP